MIYLARCDWSGEWWWVVIESKRESNERCQRCQQQGQLGNWETWKHVGIIRRVPRLVLGEHVAHRRGSRAETSYGARISAD